MAVSRRRRREKLRHRQEILDAALELFSEKGFHNVTMQEIAAKSEFAIGTLYSFFADKETLYNTMLRELLYEFQQAIADAISSGEDEVEMLRRYVVAKGTVFRDNLPVIRLYHKEASGLSSNVRAGLYNDVRNQHLQFIDRLAGVFRDGIQKGRFEPIADPLHLAVAIDSLTSALLLHCLEDPENKPYPQDPDVVLNILFKGLLES
jgi:TetR/AcrR family transcriptional regulator